MKKIFSLSLMATALLISGNLQAQNVCKIGGTEYATLQEAIAVASITVGEYTTITMIHDVDINFQQGGTLFTIDGGRQIIWDLNGKTIYVHSETDAANKGVYCMVINGSGTEVQIIDSKEGGKQGKFIYKNNSEKYLTGNDSGVAELIRLTNGKLIIKDGYFAVETPHNLAVDGNYCVDICTADDNAHPLCIIEGGEFHNSWDCVRAYAQNGTNAVAELSVTGGRFFGENGIFFEQAQKDNQKSIITISGCYAECENKENGLVRVWTSGPGQMTGMQVNISGAEANVSALKIQHMTGTASIKGKNVNYDELSEEEIKALMQELENDVKTFESTYETVFNISGGTFLNDSYIIMSGIMQTKDENGNLSFGPAENGTPVFTNYKLPTLLEGIYCDEESHILPGGQDAYPDEITVVPVHFSTPSDGDFMQDEKKGANVTENLDIIGTENKAYSLIVKNNATITVKDGAILTIGQGGITVEEGSKIIVEAGGILRIGDRGFEGTGADALIVHTNLNKSGVVSISPNAYLNDAPQLTIMMASRGYTDDKGNRWQYFAIPTKDASLQIPTGVYTYMYNWDVDLQDWNLLSLKSQVNEPFRGYIMTNSSAAAGNVTYTMQGNMNGRDDAVLKLKGDGDEENWNFFGNSYLAPIDMSKFLTSMKNMDDAVGAERTICVYDAQKGSYESINKGMIGDPNVKTVIPPMNAFFINLKNASSANVLLDYSECVYGNEVTTAMYAPARQQVKANSMKITIAGETNIDNIRFFEGADFSDAFDNDYEASKMMNDGVNIYAELNNSKLAAVANSNLDGTQLHFQADNAVEYTMTISNNNCNGYVLVDNANGARVAMTEGATYTFVATPNSTDANRFEIRKITSVVTGNEDAVVDGRKDGTYLVKDRLVIVKNGKAFNVLGL